MDPSHALPASHTAQRANNPIRKIVDNLRKPDIPGKPLIPLSLGAWGPLPSPPFPRAIPILLFLTPSAPAAALLPAPPPPAQATRPSSATSAPPRSSCAPSRRICGAFIGESRERQPSAKCPLWRVRSRVRRRSRRRPPSALGEPKSSSRHCPAGGGGRRAELHAPRRDDAMPHGLGRGLRALTPHPHHPRRPTPAAPIATTATSTPPAPSRPGAPSPPSPARPTRPR
jgi:hypothetical protein